MPTRISLDAESFGQICIGQIATVTGYDSGRRAEHPCEISLQDIGRDAIVDAVKGNLRNIAETKQLLDHDNFLTILDRMDEYGGSFVKQLAAMARRADPTNRWKCVYTWPQYFLDYSRPINEPV